MSCKSDSASFNDVVKEAASKTEVKATESTPSTAIESNDEKLQSSASETVIEVKEEKEDMVKEEAQPKVEKPKPPKPKKKPKVGVMSFDTYLYEFGTIAEGDIVKHDFYFTNTGNGVINVKNATATCGCTSPSYPFIPIAPGEKGYIGVTYNSVGKSGVQTPVVTVVSNSKEKIVKLKLTGQVLPKEEKSTEVIDTSSTLPQ